MDEDDIIKHIGKKQYNFQYQCGFIDGYKKGFKDAKGGK